MFSNLKFKILRALLSFCLSRLEESDRQAMQSIFVYALRSQWINVPFDFDLNWFEQNLTTLLKDRLDK